MDVLRSQLFEMIAASRGPLLVLDDALNVLAANPAYHARFGSTPETVDGQPAKRVFAQAHAGFFSELRRTLLEQGTLEDYPLTLDVPDGRKTFLAKVYCLNAETSVLLVTLAEIDENSPVHHNRNGPSPAWEETTHPNHITGILDDIVFLVNMDGTLHSLNPAFEAVFGLPVMAFTGRQVHNLIHPDDRPAAVAAFKEIVQRRITRKFELRIQVISGRSMDFEIKAAPRLRNGQVIGIWGIARDVTIQNRTLRSLHESQTRQNLVNDILTRLVRRQPIETIIDHTIRQLAAIFKPVRVAYNTLSENGLLTVVRSIEPAGMPPLEGIEIDLRRAPDYLNCLRRREIMIIPDVMLETRMGALKDSLLAGNTRAVLDVPLYHFDRVVGLLCFDAPHPRDWSLHEVATLSQVAECLSVALQEAFLREQRLQAELALRESEHKFRLLAENIGAAFWIFDMRTKQITYTNPLYPQISGHSMDKVRSDAYSWLDNIHPEDKEKVLAFVAAQESGQQTECEYRVRGPDGIRWLHARAFPAFDQNGQQSRITGILEDVTERKQAAQHALELALEREKMALITNFVDDITHDFRTPITVTKTSAYLVTRFTGVLVDQLTEILNGISDPAALNVKLSEVLETTLAVNEHGTRLRSSVDHLHRLTESLLEMFRLDLHRDFDFTACNLNTLILQTVDVEKTPAAAKELTVTLELEHDLPLVQADDTEFRRVIQNLVENAIRYTPKGGEIAIRTCHAVMNNQVLMEVSDTGVGIAEESLPYIFDRFYRADEARSAKNGGMGLGLAIVKKIVAAHNGTISVESALGSGTTFRVTLPAAPGR